MNAWWLIIGMLAITFSIRYGLFAWPNLRFPPWLGRALHYVPVAVLTAIVVPGLLMPEDRLAMGWDNAYLLAGLATIAIAAISRHLLATILGGLVTFMLLRGLLGQLPL
ncbi:AzlD domain-containing protein [Billgrantia endophytica]|uniref:Branched-chain amino acid transport n=1 Tax=Billgrantia endophytica TaxID=2033802 RepID=A0A2N7U1T7_9GAMM|nr:AzlD domain-containing protein [Halomonas endophytica]PMR74391.1 branched-chain amino acid transport [Halomonas endophytica]